MKKAQILVAFLIFVLVFTVWTPAPAAASAPQPVNSIFTNLTIANNSAGPVTIELTGGPKEYKIYAPVGVSAKEILKGKYVATFTACEPKRRSRFPTLPPDRS